MPGTCDGALREGISKAFFFEKKRAKNLTLGTHLAGSVRKGIKVFWFFFSKKNLFFLHHAQPA